MKIGFIDSGIGGLSVMKAFISYPILADYFYIADTAHLPYGLKTHDYIHDRVEKLTRYLIDTHHIDCLVIACNTATAISAEKLRKQMPDFPIIGIEPAIKPAALASKNKAIAILATTSMINNPRLTRLINEFASDVNVSKIPADHWVTLVEQGIFNGPQARAIIHNTLQSVKNLPIDQLILGCTHFPFLESELRSILNTDIVLVNPAAAVAKHTLHCLELHNIETNTSSTYHYFTTGNRVQFNNQTQQLQMPEGSVQALAV
ncbi:glutamate racemase [Wohlfahrtiimonas larvae]|uniref:Glutamate racemase n=1 Tax=Wohlfahrtiimonas larvae TaxID=1157986 RepID=A0ABP9MFE7_9GAMM|nr:glutamate racemase [Wohlfahrtiimonas larvae]